MYVIIKNYYQQTTATCSFRQSNYFASFLLLLFSLFFFFFFIYFIIFLPYVSILIPRDNNEQLRKDAASLDIQICGKQTSEIVLDVLRNASGHNIVVQNN